MIVAGLSPAYSQDLDFCKPVNADGGRRMLLGSIMAPSTSLWLARRLYLNLIPFWLTYCTNTTH